MKKSKWTAVTILLGIFTFLFCLSASKSLGKQPSNPNETISKILGEWTCIAYVENITDFVPENEVPPEALFLKGIVFKNAGAAAWIFDDDYSRTAQWDTEKITSGLERAALYSLKQINDQAYLFVEWISNDVTLLNRKPGYYILKKSTVQKETAALNPDAIGKWTIIDFVEKIEQFDPKHRSLNALPPLRKLYFQKNGTVWWIYEKNFKRQKTWGGDAVNFEPSYPAHFTIQKINEKDYMFMEWISGDVTERGQKPRYYVLKKAGQ